MLEEKSKGYLSCITTFIWLHHVIYRAYNKQAILHCTNKNQVFYYHLQPTVALRDVYSASYKFSPSE